VCRTNISISMLTYFLLYPSTTRVLHTETAALDLSVSVVEDAIAARLQKEAKNPINQL
jgi:hypothetical protein